ncbi:unnamed protein product [Mytilus coruscus]|uniref:Uncharacterized protein n=1 Tax=Mytilus coruscus TaxID=42192 RepID=A0A6J8DQ92_MYTCO|nr:unnamed protein product [Mytilus coruscus]
MKCSINIDKEIGLEEKGWHWIKSYKWTENSKLRLIDALLTENVKNEIIEFEMVNNEENLVGVDEATEKLTKILDNISSLSCKATPKIKRRKKKKKFKQVCEYINQNPKEYWNILKSLKNKTEKDEIPEVLKDEEVLIKHFQDQGKPSSINNAIMIDIESKLKLLENNIDFKAETDAPISCSEVKKIAFLLSGYMNHNNFQSLVCFRGPEAEEGAAEGGVEAAKLVRRLVTSTGVPMGNSLSPKITDLRVYEVLNSILRTFQHKQNIYSLYVFRDDCFFIYNEGTYDEIAQCFEHA